MPPHGRGGGGPGWHRGGGGRWPIRRPVYYGGYGYGGYGGYNYPVAVPVPVSVESAPVPAPAERSPADIAREQAFFGALNKLTHGAEQRMEHVIIIRMVISVVFLIALIFAIVYLIKKN